MPSDLNLKKSWNPNLMKNRERVWQREQEVLQQFRNNKTREQKLEEIKTKNELLSLNPNFKNDSESKISWMYKGPNNTDNVANEANEDFLLGKRRLTDLVTDNDNNSNKNKPQSYSRMDKVINSDSLQESTEEKDSILDKNDPMYTIKLQERNRQEMVSKQKQLKEFQEKENAKNKSNNHKDKHHHHSRHHHHHRHRSNSKDSKLDRQHCSTSSRDHDPLRSKHSYRDRS